MRIGRALGLLAAFALTFAASSAGAAAASPVLTVQAGGSSYAPGATVTIQGTLTISGVGVADAQVALQADGVPSGNRYWVGQVTTGTGGAFSDSFVMPSNVNGDTSVKVWATADNATSTTTLSISAVTPGGGGGGGASTSQPTSNSTVDATTDATQTQTGNTTQLTVDTAALTQNIQGATDDNVVFKASTQDGALTIPGAAVGALQNSNDVVTLATSDGSYSLPVGKVLTADTLQSLGATSASQVQISVAINHPTNYALGSLTQVVAPLSFTVTASVGGQTTTLDQFSTPVARTFALPQGQSTQDATGVVFVNGTPEHAWTSFSGDTATIYSLTDSTYAIVTQNVTFDDIAGLPQASAIQNLADKLVISGTSKTTFSPQGGVTRAQFAALLVRGLGYWNLGQNVKFSDIPADYWAAPVVKSAVAKGFILGYPNGKFEPGLQITNEQMAAMVARVMNTLNIKAGSQSATPADLGAIPAWARNDVQLVLSQGIMTVNGQGDFQPNAVTTRAQAAQIVWNLMSVAGIE